MKRVFPLLLICFLFSVLKSFGQTTSNEGINFWTVFPTHVPSNSRSENLAKVKVYVTSRFNSEVTVSCGGGYSETKVIPANTAVGFDVTRNVSYIDVAEANATLTNRGIHIQVTDGKPKVSVYTHIYAGARSAASLVLPYESLGQTYYSMNYSQAANPDVGDNFLVVVGVENDTQLIINRIGRTPISVTLNIGDVYEYLERGSDLTGISVTTDLSTTSACKRFAAFSGSSAVFIGACKPGTNSLDPLFQQLYSTASWGQNYGVVPFKDRKYVLRVIARSNNTNVYLNGQLVENLNDGEFFETAEFTQSASLTSDKPISVAQYSLSRDCSSTTGTDKVGDPDMVILNPIEFNINNITVFSSNDQNITEKYLNILIKNNQSSSFRINGVKPNIVWQALNGEPTLAYAQIKVDQESLILSADVGFNAIAYGFGNYESYAYSAGTNLAANNYLTVINTGTNTKNDDLDGCIGQEYQLNITIPYEAKSITWTLDNETPTVTLSPIPVKQGGTVQNGDAFYEYESPFKRTFTTAGEHKILANIVVDANSTCFTGLIDLPFNFNIYNLPAAAFDPDIIGCEKSKINFKDLSSSNNANIGIGEWLWDFGDKYSEVASNTSSEQNPDHIYSKPGKYLVTLTVKLGPDCPSTVQHYVTIYPLPIPKFEAPDKSCIGVEVNFTDKTYFDTPTLNSPIIEWLWDFGDGTSGPERYEQNPKHRYSEAREYTVTLQVIAMNGNCSSEELFKKQILILNAPIASIVDPLNYCIDDREAMFVSSSKNSDGTEIGLTYQWSFKKSKSDQPIIFADGKFVFPSVGDFLIGLEVTNELGCTDFTEIPFKVNGVDAFASLEVLKGNISCSDKTLNIKIITEIGGAKIIRLEIFKDGTTLSETIEKFNGENIIINYDSFGGNSTIKKNIIVKAYTGQSCYQSLTKTITLNPSPQLVFKTIPKICTDDGTLLIKQAEETTGLIGKGIYSGIGIDTEGNFNAKVAGPGAHLLTYTYNAENGCLAFVTQMINVFPSPIISLPTQVFVLAGGQIKLPASAIGDNLIYRWTPSFGSAFLDRDNILNPTVTPTADITYTLTASTADGCSTVAKVFVKVLEGLEVANAFSPNGDGVNDFWVIKYLETYPNATVEVFNRNGGRVFFSKGYDNPFDGNYQNSPLPVGVYYYIINPNNGRKLITGPLTIIK